MNAQTCAEGASDGTSNETPLKCDEANGWVPKYTTKPGGGEPIPCKSEVCTQDEDFFGDHPTCCVKANTCDGGRFGKPALACGDGSVFDEDKASALCQGTDGTGDDLDDVLAATRVDIKAKCTLDDFQNKDSTCCKDKSE